MKKTIRAIALCFAAGFLTACSSIPDSANSYLFPVTQITYTVTQMLTCNTTNTHVYSSVSATAIATNVADRWDPKQHSFSYKTIDGKMIDTGLEFDFTSDGSNRLAGVNTTSTGEAPAVIKSMVAIGVAAAVGVPAPRDQAAAAAAEATAAATYAKKACTVINQYGDLFTKQDKTTSGTGTGSGSGSGAHGAGGGTPVNNGTPDKPTAKILTLTYTLAALHVVESPNVIDIIPLGEQVSPEPVHIPPDAASAEAYQELKAIYQQKWQDFTVSIPEVASSGGTVKTKAISLTPPINWTPKTDDGFAPLELNRLVSATILLSGPVDNLTSSTNVWKQEFILPQRGNPYNVPVPVGKAFGKSSFALALADNGAITKISYNKTSGAADAISTVGQLASIKTDYYQQEETANQAYSDARYQQERKLVCEANLASCPSK